MTFETIQGYDPINETDPAKVQAIAESIRANGWQGAPILFVDGEALVTGSHRIEALKSLYDWEDDWVLDLDCCEDVTEEVCAYCEREDVTMDMLPLDTLRLIFAGTWVEEYKDELAEW